MKRTTIILLAGAALGAIAGWLYWQFVGCDSGGCAITSSPVNSSIYGAVMGGLTGNLFLSDRKNPRP